MPYSLVHKLLLTLTISLFMLSAKGQQIQENNYGINGGIVIALGTHFDRIGITMNTYYVKNHLQFNSELRVYFSFKNLGPKKSTVEAVSSFGLAYGYGKRQGNDTNFFYQPVSNQTGYRNSFAYAFNCYFNPLGTTQQTGTIAIQVDHFSFITENDIFARPILDRFRTGAFLLQYQENNMSFGINSTLFTGEMGEKITDPNYPHNHLYKNNIGGKFTEHSNGLLSAQFQYVSSVFQKYQGSLGIDSERVRHAIQNRFVHDMVFLPENWRKKDAAHLPMLNDKGGQYLFKSDQKVKPPSFYLNIFSNPSLFY